MKNSVKMFSLGQIAAICGIGFRTVERWVRKGYLGGGYHPESSNRISNAEIVAFLERRYMNVPAALREQMPLKALIVEDDRPMGNAIERTLLRLGFETARESGGLGAVRKIYEFKPDLITLDLRTEDMHGSEVLRVLKRIRPDCDSKIIVISGAEESEIVKALWLGSQGFLKKPFLPNQLIQLVRQLMDRAA